MVILASKAANPRILSSGIPEAGPVKHRSLFVPQNPEVCCRLCFSFEKPERRRRRSRASAFSLLLNKHNFISPC
ncbi:hypothetical protein NXS19_007704 [Fusarium pseudograminearum]|nr:hypothetical protein NXS19_007704 [Fusarium pseudograminearum]